MTATVDVALLLAFMLYSAIGACTRALFGVYKAYGSNLLNKITMQRVVIEIAASVFFGTFASILLQELGWLAVSMEAVALLSGFFGADLIGIVSKKVGLRTGLKVQLAEEMMEYADLTGRQEAGIRYLEKHGRITNDTYEKLTSSTHDSAKYDLQQLVRMKRIRQHGSGKGTHYTLVK